MFPENDSIQDLFERQEAIARAKREGDRKMLNESFVKARKYTEYEWADRGPIRIPRYWAELLNIADFYVSPDELKGAVADAIANDPDFDMADLPEFAWSAMEAAIAPTTAILLDWSFLGLEVL